MKCCYYYNNYNQFIIEDIYDAFIIYLLIHLIIIYFKNKHYKIVLYEKYKDNFFKSYNKENMTICIFIYINRVLNYMFNFS